ncbi:FAD:protein FMN transferase [Deinococcus aerophilus]|nr:FAD:protein FMN transferase [Deinococcus aerophilus]
MSGLLFPLLRALQPPYRLRSVYQRLLGTEVELQIVARTRRLAESAEGTALSELERLSAVLNRFDPHSELSRWLTRPGECAPLSAELRAVLTLADGWRVRTGGAFHPGADALGGLWQRAANQGREPDAAERAEVAGQLRAAPWTLHGDGTATLHAAYPLGLSALAKGFIVDRMAGAAHASPGVEAVLVNAGGDLRTLGGRGLNVAVADPFTARDDAPPLTRVHVRDGALASSGGAHRGRMVGGVWRPHLLDPRDGRPVQDVSGVTVTAPDCATADALATALSVLGPGAGLGLAEDIPGCAALIVSRDGTRHSSRHWPHPP